MVQVQAKEPMCLLTDEPQVLIQEVKHEIYLIIQPRGQVPSDNNSIHHLIRGLITHPVRICQVDQGLSLGPVLLEPSHLRLQVNSVSNPQAQTLTCHQVQKRVAFQRKIDSTPPAEEYAAPETSMGPTPWGPQSTVSAANPLSAGQSMPIAGAIVGREREVQVALGPKIHLR